MVVLFDLSQASPCNSSKLDMFMWYDILKKIKPEIYTKMGQACSRDLARIHIYIYTHIVGVHRLCICKCIVKVAYLAHISLCVYKSIPCAIDYIQTKGVTNDT